MLLIAPVIIVNNFLLAWHPSLPEPVCCCKSLSVYTVICVEMRASAGDGMVRSDCLLYQLLGGFTICTLVCLFVCKLEEY